MPPKKSRIGALYEDLRRYYSTMHATMRREHNIFTQRFEGIIDVPYEVQIFRSSTASNIIEGFRNQIRTNEPTIDFRAAGTSVAARKHATLMQRWGYGQLRKERDFAIVDPNLQCGLTFYCAAQRVRKFSSTWMRSWSAPLDAVLPRTMNGSRAPFARGLIYPAP